MLSNLAVSVFDNCTFFSQYCLLCGQRPAAQGLCLPCRAALPRQPGHRCPRCDALALSPQRPCGDCQRLRPAFGRLYSAYDYDYPLQALIRHCKSTPAPALQTALASLMPQALRQGMPAPLPDLIVPVPLAPERQLTRGFNLPDALAQALADTMRVPLDGELCWRKRNTPRQTGLNRQQRLHNVRDAFGVKRRCDGLFIAIVDDVASTGATLHAMAKTLQKAGAKQVDAWVLARAVFRQA